MPAAIAIALLLLAACSTEQASSDDVLGQCRTLDPARLREVDNTSVVAKTIAEEIKLKWEHPAVWAVASTKSLLDYVEMRLRRERRDKGAFPVNLQDFEVDAWGAPLRYEASLDRFRACSSGMDGTFGTTDDMCVTFTPESADAAMPPACKKFLDRYKRCIDGMPEAARGPARDGLREMEDAWSMAPKDDGMNVMCQQAYDSAKGSMRAACPNVPWD